MLLAYLYQLIWGHWKNVKYPILKGIYFCILISFSVSLKSNHGSGNSNLGKSSMHTHTYILLGLIFSICIEFIFLLIVFLQLILRSICILFNIYHNGKKDAHPYSKWRVILLFLCLSQSTKWIFHRWIKWSWSYVMGHKDCHS